MGSVASLHRKDNTKKLMEEVFTQSNYFFTARRVKNLNKTTKYEQQN